MEEPMTNAVFTTERTKRVVESLKYWQSWFRWKPEELAFPLWILIAQEYFPEELAAIDKILEPAAEILDVVIAGADPNRVVDVTFLRELEQKAKEMAKRRLQLDREQQARAEFQKLQAEACERIAMRLKQSK